jgi:hypothetical protein
MLQSLECIINADPRWLVLLVTAQTKENGHPSVLHSG